MDPRRMRLFLVVVVLVGTPAAALRAACAGASCPEPVAPVLIPPFCGLPDRVRALVAAGYREDRSPDVLAVTSTGTVLATTGAGERPTPWPSLDRSATQVPIVFVGAGVGPGALEAGTTLDAVAPTVAASLGVERPFPDVRSGRRADGVAGGPGRASLGVIVVWSAIGTSDLLEAPDASWSGLRRALASGVGSLEGSTGSLPVDPTAALATIGVGALPSQHGVVGRVVRSPDGGIARAWDARAPIPVLATLAEDMDETSGQRARVGLVGTDRGDRVLVGGSWYPQADVDDVVLGTSDPVAEVRSLLRDGYGADPVPDLMGVVLHGRLGAMDRTTTRIVRIVRTAFPAATVAIAGTGSLRADGPVMDADAIRGAVDGAAGASVVRSVSSSGVFIDATSGVGADAVARALRTAGLPDGGPVLADAYPGFSVALGGYC